MTDCGDCRVRSIGIGIGDDHAGIDKFLHLRFARLRIRIGARDRGHDYWPSFPSGKKRDEMAGGISMATVAEHDIKQNDSDARISKRFRERSIAHRRLEHRVWTSSRECIVTKVDQDVTVLRADHRRRARHGHVGHHGEPGLPKHDLSFAAKRSACEQAAHQLACIRSQ